MQAMNMKMILTVNVMFRSAYLTLAPLVLTLMALPYEQRIQRAFRDVSNALIAYRNDREFRIQQEKLLESPQDPCGPRLPA
jgi:hypothetical protein